MGRYHRLTGEEIEKIRHMIEVERLQQWKVADEIGVHVTTIEGVCKRLQLKTVHCGSRTGPESAHWRGGRVMCKGYWHVRVPNHPYARKSGYVAEHRLVMENKLGRYLLPGEVCHHIDGDRENNAPENLMVFQTNAAHLSHELRGRVPNWTPEGKEAIRKSLLGNTSGRLKGRGAGRLPQSNDHPTTQSDNTCESQVSETEPSPATQPFFLRPMNKHQKEALLDRGSRPFFLR
jgi:uncharacterized protein (DUF1330 family)